ncbi:MAG: hypothetical protein QXP05_05355 [Ignisphaera sp.]
MLRLIDLRQVHRKIIIVPYDREVDTVSTLETSIASIGLASIDLNLWRMQKVFR